MGIFEMLENIAIFKGKLPGFFLKRKRTELLKARCALISNRKERNQYMYVDKMRREKIIIS